MKQVQFTRMDEGSPEDFALLDSLERQEKADLPDQVLALLKTLQAADSGYQVDRYEHSLQTATRAMRDGAEEELVVCALLHDVGDLIAPDNHAEIAASILAPYISERSQWILRHHGLFQGYYYWHHIGRNRHAREPFRGHEHFAATESFCARWDQVSFDPSYDTLPIEAFEPLVRRILAREPRRPELS